MASHRLVFRAVDKNIFEYIKSGEKQVESRAGSVNYLKFAKGDEVVFVCGKEKFKRKISKIKVFKSISSMLKYYSLKQLHPGMKSKSQLEKLINNFPGYKERVRKFGLIAFEVE